MAAASNYVTISSLESSQLRHKRRVESLAYGQSLERVHRQIFKGQPQKVNIILYGKTPTSRRGHQL